jgi:hypothetical protein
VLALPVSPGLLGADPEVITVPDPDTVSPGFLGFVVVFLLAIATVLLIRSMVGHLRKVRYSPEPGDPRYPAAPNGRPGASGRPGRNGGDDGRDGSGTKTSGTA